MRPLPSDTLGAVAAGHTESAKAGAQVLERGGNAVDAVVAMILAACVNEGTLTSLGGGGFITVCPPGGSPQVIDCFIRQPGIGAPTRGETATWELFELPLDGLVLRFGTGPASVGVPALPLGLAHASERYGRLLFSACAEPALGLATDGVELTRSQASEHSDMFDLLCRTPEGRSIYEHSGIVGDDDTSPHRGPRPMGARFRQPELADTIERITATGGRDLYEGSLARRLLTWSTEHGGRITADDLAQCAAIDRVPLAHQFSSGPTLYTNPVPSMGGGLMVVLLQRLAEGLPIPAAVLEIFRAMRPPRTVPPVAGESVVAPDLTADLRSTVGDLIELSKSPSTTHVCAIDAEGWMASATTTVGFGSGEFIPGSGVQLNNVLAEYGHRTWRPPGATVPSMMSPSVVTGDSLQIAIGSAGSDRIPQAISQVLLHAIEEGASLEDALRAPRCVYDGEGLHWEPGHPVSDAEARSMLECSHTDWSAHDGYFGTVNAVFCRDGVLEAAGDPRREGAGIVV
jgi:gamma-glutamyltranspeptidase/glutathione hydrolase